jgi:hypothetical protein
LTGSSDSAAVTLNGVINTGNNTGIAFVGAVEALTINTTGAASSCRIPDDCIDSKRYPLFMVREVMRQLIDNLCITSAVHPGALS